MNSQEITIEKFHACTGVPKHLLQVWINMEEQNNSTDEIDLQHFKEIIENYHMNEYSKLLINYMGLKLGHQQSIKESAGTFKELNNKVRESKRLKSELIDALEYILSPGKILTVQFNKSKGIHPIANVEFINLIVEKLTEEYYKRGFNVTVLTEAEAEEIFKSNTDSEWFSSWKEELEYFDDNGDLIKVDDFKEGEKYFSPAYGESHDSEFVYNEMISQYALSHSIPRTVDLQLIKQLNKGEKMEAGIKPKNKVITQVAIVLADLRRIDVFIKDPNMNEIDKITVGNSDARFINDCLVCFGMIVDKSIPYNKEYRPQDYTRSLLKNKKISKKPDIQDDLRRERHVDLKKLLSSI